MEDKSETVLDKPKGNHNQLIKRKKYYRYQFTTVKNQNPYEREEF